MGKEKRGKNTAGILVLFLIILVSSVVFSGSVFAFKDSNGNKIGDDLEDKFENVSAGEKVKLIIKLDEIRNQSIDEIENSAGKGIGKRLNLVNSISIEVPEQAAKNIAEKDFVERVELDYDVETVLDDSIEQINTDLVWDENISGEGVDISIIDTGIYSEHDALSDSIEKEKDFTSSGSTNDGNGHGTHVAGIVSSEDSRYKGVAFNSDLYNAKVLNSDGSGYASDVIDGIEWSVSQGAEIISLSLGAEVDTCDGTDVLSEAVDEAVSKGVVVVVAAGNNGPDSYTITSPGCSKKGITVGAVDSNDDVPDFSSRGPTDDKRVKPDLLAPGVSITSTWKDGNFKSLSGTSMATPHVSGLVGLLLSVNSSLNPSDVKSELKENALDIGENESTQGAGRIKAYETIEKYLKPLVSISDFYSSEEEVYVNDSVNVTVLVSNTGRETAENVTAILNLPEGLITNDSLESFLGNISSSETVSKNWSVMANESGEYSLSVGVNSSNDGYDSSKTSISVLSNETEDGNETEDNETEENETESPEDNETKKDCDWLPPGLRKKNNLPRGWQKECPEAGATPGSFFHNFERMGEGLKLAFTFNKEKKAEYKMNLAEERLAEAGKLLREGDEEKNFENLEKALKNYEENLKDVDNFIEESEFTPGIREENEGLSNFSSRFAESSSFHQTILKEISESKNLPEEASFGINRALSASNKSFQDSLGKLRQTMPEKAAEVEYEVAERKLNRVRNKIEEQAREKAKGKIDEAQEKIDDAQRKVEEAKEKAEREANGRANKSRPEFPEENETKKNETQERIADNKTEEAKERGKEKAEESKGKIDEEKEEAKEKAEEAKEKAKGKIDEGLEKKAEQLEEEVNKLKEKAEEEKEKAKERKQEAKEKEQEKSKDKKEEAKEKAEDKTEEIKKKDEVEEASENNQEGDESSNIPDKAGNAENSKDSGISEGSGKSGKGNNGNKVTGRTILDKIKSIFI